LGNVQTKEDLTRLSFYGYRVSNRFCEVQELGENEMRKILLTLLSLSVVVCFLWNLSYAEEREKPHSLLYVQQIYYENGYWDNLQALIGPPDGEYAYSRNPSYTVPTAILDFGKVVFSGLISIYHYDPHAEETSLDIYISLNASGPYEYLGEVDGTGVNELEFDGRTFRYIKIVQSQTYPGQEDGIDAIGVAEESFREIPMPFQDDFEAYPVGQAPPAPWTTLNFSSVVSSEVSHSGTKSVKVWGGPYVSRSAVIDLGRNYPNHLRLEAYVFLSGTDSRGWIGFFEQIYNMAPQFNCVYFGDEHKIYFVSGDTNYPINELLSGNWTPGVWHQVRIDYDYSNLRANVYLDAELIGQDIPMSPKEATWEYQGIHYFNLSKVGVLHGEGNSIYVDDFSITEVTQHGLKPPTLISPQNGAVLDNGCKDHSDSIEWDFDWSDVPGATKYHIYVILENAVNPVIDAITTASSYHYSSLGAYIEDAHRFNLTWKVRAGNDSSEWSEWSEVRYFDVEPLDTDCQVEVRPLAQFTADKTEGTKPLTVQFIDQSTGNITSWFWDFGDRETSTEQNPSHTYNNTGYFTVSLTVTGPGGSVTETKGNYIHVIEEFGDKIKITNVKMYIGETPLDITDPVFLNGVDLDVKFEPEIDWGNETHGTIKYITPSGTYEETGPKTFNVGTEFGVGGKLKVVAVSDGIESDPYEVPFEVAPVPVGESSWFSFNTDSMEYSNLVSVVFNFIKENISSAHIPTTIPIFGGKTVGINVLRYVDIEVGLNGKGRFVGGGRRLKDSFVSYAGKRIPVVEKEKGGRVNLAKQCQIRADFDIGAGFSYDKVEKKWNYGGSLGLGFEGYCQLPPYYIVVSVGPVPIPLYARLGTGIDAYNSLTLLGLNFNSSGGLSFIDPTWDGLFTVYPYGKLMFGVGAADVAAVEGYGKGGLEASFHYPDEPHLEDICIKLNAGVTLVIFVFHHDFDLWHYDWCLSKAKAGFQALELLLGTSDTELTPLPRNYLKKRPYARFYKQGPVGKFKAMLMGVKEGILKEDILQENILQENIYPYSQPVIVSRNGDTYIFWLYDDPERGSLNRTELVFSKWTESGWTTFKAVSDDGTADFHPKAGILPDGRVLVVWENVKQELPDDATLDDMVSKMEISYAIYNPTTDKWESGTLTNNAFLDRSPKLAIGEDGTALLVWIENRGNDLIGGSNNLMYAFWNGNNLAFNQTIATDLGPIINTSLAYKKEEGVLIWESDEDYDLSTGEDRELRVIQFNKGTGWQNEGLFTQDNVPDLNPQVLYRNGEPYLIWLKDNDLVMVKDLDPSSQMVVVEDMKSQGGMSFKAINRSQGLTLVWSDSSEKGADIYVAYFDDNHNKWGKPKQLTDDDSLERSLDGYYIDADTLKLIYDKVKVNYTTEGIPQPERTDLYTLSYKEGTDILLNNISLSKSSPVLWEDILITAEVANIGESVEGNIPVSFYKGNPQAGGELIGTAYVDGLLVPEESKEVSINWRVDETPTGIYAVADPNHEITNDRNWGNNTINIPIGTELGDVVADIKVNNSDGPIIVGQSHSLSITASLDNNGRTDNADWWLAADTPFGLYFFTFDGWTDAWVPGYQGPLFYLDSFEVLNMPVSGLPAGTYTLYFGVDTVMDGNVTWDSVYCDTVEVNITE